MLADEPGPVKETAGGLHGPGDVTSSQRARMLRTTSRQAPARRRSCILVKTLDSPAQASTQSRSVSMDRWKHRRAPTGSPCSAHAVPCRAHRMAPPSAPPIARNGSNSHALFQNCAPFNTGNLSRGLDLSQARPRCFVPGSRCPQTFCHLRKRRETKGDGRGIEGSDAGCRGNVLPSASRFLNEFGQWDDSRLRQKAICVPPRRRSLDYHPD